MLYETSEIAYSDFNNEKDYLLPLKKSKKYKIERGIAYANNDLVILCSNLRYILTLRKYNKITSKMEHSTLL